MGDFSFSCAMFFFFFAPLLGHNDQIFTQKAMLFLCSWGVYLSTAYEDQTVQ